MTENVTIESYQAPLFAKMARVMGKMSRLEKRGHNDHFNYDYATSEDVSDLVRQAMSEEKIAFFVNVLETQRTEKITKTLLQFVFADGETGATYTCRWESEATDTMDKGISKAVTSGVKYFLLKTFLISTGDEPDPDGDDKPDKAKGKQPEAKQKPTEQQPQSTDGKRRPYSPEKVKEALHLKATKHTDFQPTEKQIQLLRYGLELCFAGQESIEDKRHTLLHFLTGDVSTKAVSGSMFKAILEDWLKAEQDSGGEYRIDPMAAKEAQMIVNAALVGEGQQTLL